MEINDLYTKLSRAANLLNTSYKEIPLQVLLMFVYIAKTGDTGTTTADLSKKFNINKVQVHRILESLHEYITYNEYRDERPGPSPREYKVNNKGKYILENIIRGN